MTRRSGLVGVVAGAALMSLAIAPSALARAHMYKLTAGPVARVAQKQLDFDVFFAKSVTIHRGDSVQWAIHGFHTVTFLAHGQKLPPLVVADPTHLVSGLLDPAGAPFWFDGKVPTLAISPMVAFPSGGSSYSGHSFVNSGLPGGPGPAKPFKLKFPKDGVFHYYCIVHPGMIGTIKVVSARRRVASPAQVAKQARAEQRKLVSLAIKLGRIKPTGGHVRAGNDSNGVAWLRFFPANLTIKAGQTVSFANHAPQEPHTITFGPESYTKPLEDNFTSVVPNPAGPPSITLNAIASYPSDPGPLPPYDGTNHGIGFENTGILQLGTSQPSSAAITFTKPGVYRYECVIHPGMNGTITVTP